MNELTMNEQEVTIKTLNTEQIEQVTGGCQVGDCWPDPLNLPPKGSYSLV